VRPTKIGSQAKLRRRPRSSWSNSPSPLQRLTLSSRLSSGQAEKTTPARPRRSGSFSAMTAVVLVGMVTFAELKTTDRRSPGQIAIKTDRTPTLKTCRRSLQGLLQVLRVHARHAFRLDQGHGGVLKSCENPCLDICTEADFSSGTNYEAALKTCKRSSGTSSGGFRGFCRSPTWVPRGFGPNVWSSRSSDLTHIAIAWGDQQGRRGSTTGNRGAVR
jgi:hypothetical protein